MFELLQNSVMGRSLVDSKVGSRIGSTLKRKREDKVKAEREMGLADEVG